MSDDAKNPKSINTPATTNNNGSKKYEKKLLINTKIYLLQQQHAAAVSAKEKDFKSLKELKHVNKLTKSLKLFNQQQQQQQQQHKERQIISTLKEPCQNSIAETKIEVSPANTANTITSTNATLDLITSVAASSEIVAKPKRSPKKCRDDEPDSVRINTQLVAALNNALTIQTSPANLTSTIPIIPNKENNVTQSENVNLNIIQVSFHFSFRFLFLQFRKIMID